MFMSMLKHDLLKHNIQLTKNHNYNLCLKKKKDLFTDSTKSKKHNKKARSLHEVFSNPFTKMIHISRKIHLSTAISQILQDVLSTEERAGGW